MPLPGGASDKYGNRFEGKWTVFCLAQVLAEEADEIRLEPPGEEGRGCEFWLKKGNTTEYHQVKRQQAKSGAWSIVALLKNGVLNTALEKTKNQNTYFVFVSAISAGDLVEISDAARRAGSFDEFQEQFLKGDRENTWQLLLKGWGLLLQKELSVSGDVSEEDQKSTCKRIAYERLQRVYTRNIDEVSLKETVDTKLRTLVREDPEKVRDALSAFALENVHRRLFANEIWLHLEKLGYHRVDYSKDPRVLTALENLNKRYENIKPTIGDGISIPREEADEAFGILTGNGLKKSVLLAGEAGVGKTVILGQVIQKIRRAEIPYLYFRIDRLDPTDLPQRLGDQLGLPKSPVEVLAIVAKKRPSVLIIDQLDAVSVASGRNPDFFDCIREIIEQTKIFENMRLLLACRQFDLEKDNRFRELISDNGPAQKVVAKPFSLEIVRTVLQKLGYASATLSNSQMELLRLPLHLSIFAEIGGQTSGSFTEFTSSVELFDKYWDRKRRTVEQRIGGQAQWIEVIDRLSEQMTAQQTLFVSEISALDDFERTVQAMESEHVLVVDSRRVGFFHEGFFDYVFARRFIAQKRNLIEYLKENEQDLFKRAPMRQILMYQNGQNHNSFVRELGRVLTDTDIRFHLKKCALEAAMRINHASQELWDLLRKLLLDGNTALSREIWRVLIISKAWFPFLFCRGLLCDWLACGNEETQSQTLRLIANQIESFPKESVKLLEPYVGKSPDWNGKILRIIHHDALSTDRDAFHLFLEMIESNAFDDQETHDFWRYIYNLPKKHPGWAAEVLGLYLRRTLEKIKFDSLQCRFLKEDRTGEGLILEIAKNAPEPFLENVLPFFLKVVTNTATKYESKLRRDPVWSLRMFNETPLSLEDALFLGLETALRILAAGSPDKFGKYLEHLECYGDYDSVNFLLMRAFAVAVPAFANRTVEYVLDNSLRLECGWSGGGDGDLSYWVAYECVANVSQHCSVEMFANLEAAILTHYPQWERTKDGYKIRGGWQFIMLPALAPDRRTKKAEARIKELARKFPNRRIKPPIPLKAEWVSSPISSDIAEKMTDDQWLRAIAKYGDRGGLPAGLLQGGAHQLSGVLESETKRDPKRFAHLALRFPVTAHPFYFDAVLRGLREADVSKDIAFDVVREFYNLPAKPGTQWMGRLIARYSKEEIPEDVLGIIGWLATEASDPESNELKVHRVDRSDEYRPEDVLSTAINSVRGTAAEAMGTLLLDNTKRAEFFMPYLERMVHDPTLAVRSTVAYALLGFFTHDENRAIDLFVELCKSDNDVLLATHYVVSFFYYANVSHFKRLRPILRRMLDSELDIVRKAGARQACLAQFNNKGARDMVKECLTGDEAKRKGATAIAVANVFHQECYDFAGKALMQFFNDPVKEIRNEAAHCFREAEGRQLKNCCELIRAFLTSKAFAENVEDLTWALENSTADISEEILLEVCEATIGVLENQGEDPRSRLFGETKNVAKLALRVYRQGTEESFKSRCLDLIDQLLSMDAYGVTEELETHERE